PPHRVSSTCSRRSLRTKRRLVQGQPRTHPDTQISSKRRHKGPTTMPSNAVDTLPLAGSISHDLSIIGLFLQSDSIVKLVMLILLLASFWSWAVIFDKAIRIRRLRHAASNFEENFWSGGSLDDLYERVGQRPPA